MKRMFGSQPIPAEINGNTYNLPDSLTPGSRITHNKLITPYINAQNEATKAIREVQIAAKTADATGDGALDQGFLDAESKLKKAEEAVPKAARALLVGLLEPSAANQKVPTDIGDFIPDDTAIEYADTVISGARVEVDPT